MLDIKYRPQKFRDILGNHDITKLLLIRSKRDLLKLKSFMFGGPKGCGKTSYARIIARAILCLNPTDGEPCISCSYCNSVNNDNSIVFDEFDSASNGTVDKIRSIIQSLDYEMINGKPRILIFDEAQRLSPSAQDALLKPIEERKLVCIFCTTEPNKIRGPIRSRLEEYQISPPTPMELSDRLSEICRLESIEIDTEAIDMIISHFESVPRSCLNTIESLSILGKITRNTVNSYLKFNKFESLVGALEHINSNPSKSINVIDDLASTEGPSWVRDLIMDAIISSYRKHLGVVSKFPVSTKFFDVKGYNWLVIAKNLANFDKPTLSSIISVLFSDHIDKPISVLTDINSGKIVEKVQNISIPSKIQSPETKKNDFIDIGGIKFHKDGEKLTSLDDKIGGISKEPEKECLNSNSDSKNIPLSEKEFASMLLSKLRAF